MRVGGLSILGVIAAGLLTHGVCSAQDVPRLDIRAEMMRCPKGGEEVFVNREYGIAAVFPADSRVCDHPEWSDEPHGFTGRLHVKSRRGEGPFGSGPMIGVRAEYADEQPSRDLLLGDECVGESVPGPDGRPLTLPGIVSQACTIERDGFGNHRPMIMVAGSVPLTGERAEDYGRFVTYLAMLISSPETLQDDRVTFQRFLDDLVLTPGVGPAQVIDDPYLWPVEVSSGQRFVNDEYGLSAVFPEGAAVCVAQSGTHPHGYYGRMGYRGAQCSPSGDTPEFTTMTVYGDYNAADYETAAEMLSGGCQAVGAAVQGPDGRPFGFRGLPSAVCAEFDELGRVRISVVALAGRSPGQVTPAMIYSAYLIAAPETLAADKAMFARFLDALEFAPPVSHTD